MLKIRRQTQLAMLILAESAQRPEALIQIADAARVAGATAVHTASIVHMLMRGGLLKTKRGRKGGFRLARPAGAISLADVMRVTETQLVGEVPKALSISDPLEAAFAVASSSLVKTLDRTTIGDLARRCASCPARAAASESVIPCARAATARRSPLLLAL